MQLILRSYSFRILDICKAMTLNSSTLSLLLLIFSILSSCALVVDRESILAISAVPISKKTASLSIEFCYIVDYLGDIQGSNKLSKRLLQNIQDLSGEPPIIRIGGHTQDAARYSSNCTQTLTNNLCAWELGSRQCHL